MDEVLTKAFSIGRGRLADGNIKVGFLCAASLPGAASVTAAGTYEKMERVEHL